MKYSIILIISFLLLYSCKKEPSIVGAWTAIDEKILSDLEFQKNGIVDYSLGVFKSFDNINEEFEYVEGVSNYHVENNILSIYNQKDSLYKTYVVYIQKDTLILTSDFTDNYTEKGRVCRYIHRNKKKNIFFDEIIYHKPSKIEDTYSDLSKYYLTIDSSGKMMKSDPSKYGAMDVYQLSEKQVDVINKIALKFESYADASDSSKIYGLDAPMELTIIDRGKLRTIQPVQSSSQKIDIFDQFMAVAFCFSNTIQPQPEIDKIEGFKREQPENYFYYFRYNGDKNKYSYLTYSEGFYLSMLLQKAKAVDIKFDEKYVLDSSYKYNELSDEELIYTDGRYYRYKDRVVDLGYNFIDENNFNNSFVDKKDILGEIIFDPPKIF